MVSSSAKSGKREQEKEEKKRFMNESVATLQLLLWGEGAYHLVYSLTTSTRGTHRKKKTPYVVAAR
jgi:hypothetical protein